MRNGICNISMNEDGSLVIEARLPPDGGAPVLKALEATREQISTSNTAEDVSAETLCEEGETGRCAIEGGPAIAAESARRLGCDASRVVVSMDEQGEPLSIGRRSRTVPPAIRRALRRRDRGCRFPGCTQHRFVDAHHIEHWADGGETSLVVLTPLSTETIAMLGEQRFEQRLQEQLQGGLHHPITHRRHPE